MIVDVGKHHYTLAVIALAFIISASLLPPSVFAQQDDSQQANTTGTDTLYGQSPVPTDDTPTGLNITSTDVPVLQQVSEKGIYLVELKWPLTYTDPENSLQVEIVFNNASAPPPTSDTIPQREDNLTGSGIEDALTVPEVLGGEPMHVESYDIAIYTPDGRKLWEQLDQPGLGGRGTQRIELESNYTGPVSIDISDIRPGSSTNETATATDMTDSVTFTATIMPEFPLVTVLLAIGIIATILLFRGVGGGLYKINLK
ncbi:MAG: hypothetical protein M3251_01285 [Thermoproteota archaeon]|nr:hypothetical protein [Thermoproteota archaeon]